MNSKQNTVYFVPGMAAGPEIFRNIKLPDENYRIEVLEWLIPSKDESLQDYAKRMAARVKEPNAILIGVSFGGVVVQEMEKFLTLKKLIIISSVKTRSELPKRMRIAGFTKAYKLIPTSVILSAEDLTKFSIGPKSKKRLRLYQEYLNVRDKNYLDWALQKMVTWDRLTEVKGVVHIQGDRDTVFPIKYIKKSIVIPGGTHIMILNRGREISNKLLELFGE
jgi:pimeloyl-ACP methyl ester carboxylesterase